MFLIKHIVSQVRLLIMNLSSVKRPRLREPLENGYLCCRGKTECKMMGSEEREKR